MGFGPAALRPPEKRIFPSRPVKGLRGRASRSVPRKKSSFSLPAPWTAPRSVAAATTARSRRSPSSSFRRAPLRRRLPAALCSLAVFATLVRPRLVKRKIERRCWLCLFGPSSFSDACPANGCPARDVVDLLCPRAWSFGRRRGCRSRGAAFPGRHALRCKGSSVFLPAIYRCPPSCCWHSRFAALGGKIMEVQHRSVPPAGSCLCALIRNCACRASVGVVAFVSGCFRAPGSPSSRPFGAIGRGRFR